MNVFIFIGGNKHFTATRLGVKLGEELQQKGFKVSLACVKGKLKTGTGLPVYEYAASAKPKTLANTLKKEHADFVISLDRKSVV